MSISRKLLFGSLIVSVVSILLTAIITASIGFSISKEVIEAETKKMLVSQREIQKDFITNYLSAIEHELQAFSDSHSVKLASEAFLSSYDSFPNNINNSTRDAALSDYYENQFGEKYKAANINSNISATQLLNGISDQAKLISEL